LIQRSLLFFSPTGHKIPTIENLGAAKDQEAIDFTDNAIQTLSGFPLSPRLHTLLLAHNRIHAIAESTAKALPNLHTLVLTQNAVAELSDLDALEGFGKLTYVSFVGCPVASKEVSRRRWEGTKRGGEEKRREERGGEERRGEERRGEERENEHC
jgi:hypothetical protein